MSDWPLARWPTLSTAVDQKIEEQIEFVRWWKETVTPSRDRRPESENQERRFQKSDAESLTGITQQQVSKWNKRLQKSTPAYRKKSRPFREKKRPAIHIEERKHYTKTC